MMWIGRTFLKIWPMADQGNLGDPQRHHRLQMVRSKGVFERVRARPSHGLDLVAKRSFP
jgi:hypothetical protein